MQTIFANVFVLLRNKFIKLKTSISFVVEENNLHLISIIILCTPKMISGFQISLKNLID